MNKRAFFFATAAMAAVLLYARPASLWEFDEPLFSQALHHYDPIAHHPPPPGYPVFIFVARIVRWFMPSDFAALVTLSIISSFIGFALLALAFSRLTDDVPTGICGAVIFYMSPAMLVHSTLPIAEPGALALAAAALLCSRTSPALFGVFAGLAVGWRPQFSIFIVPLLLCRRISIRALVAFTLICLAWLVPLALSVDGFDRLLAFELGQAQYMAEHDAGISREIWTTKAIVAGFISHPWGQRFLAVPILIAAMAGAWRLRRSRPVLPLAIAAVIYIIVALKVMDPADAVRYAIPFSLLVALLAAAGIPGARWRSVFVAVFAVASFFYVRPLLVQRRTVFSPPVQAAEFARRTMPANAAIGYELSLWPHATYFFPDHRLFRIDASLQDVVDEPLYLYSNGYSSVPGSRSFAWESSDAYGKLTRNLYRVVSWSPIGSERRFRALRGVYAFERQRVTESWRWISGDAAIEARGATAVDLRLALPVTYPFPQNDITVIADGQIAGVIRVTRGAVVSATAVFVAPARIIELRAEHVFVPPRDPRHLAVELYDLKLDFPQPSAAKRPAA